MAEPDFISRAALERQIEAARQLRAETLAGGFCIVAAGLLGLLLVLRRVGARRAGGQTRGRLAGRPGARATARAA